MMNFSTLQGLTIPEGVVTQIAKDGVVLWSAGGDKIILKVKKITDDTYVGETAYAGEKFILLDIYPKTNGTVKITYEGLTKIVTDTSGAVEPNAQQVFFGTFNGVSDDVTTPESGILTIEGDYKGVGCSSFISDTKSTYTVCSCITGVNEWGNIEVIPDNAFYAPMLTIPLIECIFPESLKSIGNSAFSGTGSTKIHIPSSVNYIGDNPWELAYVFMQSLTVDTRNTAYTIDQNCLVEIATKRLICIRSYVDEPLNIPDYITHIDRHACYSIKNTEITIPATVEAIDYGAFQNASSLTTVRVLATTPPEFDSYVFDDCDLLTSIIVPVGSGDAYKAKLGWKNYADIIVEAS